MSRTEQVYTGCRVRSGRAVRLSSIDSAERVCVGLPMKAIIEIDMTSAAFEDNPEEELGRILHELATSIEKGSWSDKPRKLYDADLYPTGSFRVTEDA